jgi:exoribonuclease R
VPLRKVRLIVDRADGAALREGFARIRDELGVPASFPPTVLADAQAAIRGASLDGAVGPDGAARRDLRDVPFVTIDPPGSTDLDQALHIERRTGGYRVFYAIADLVPFVVPGRPVDVTARERGQTLYAPDRRTPLHPEPISEGAASLLPGQERPALVWTVELDADGAQTSADVRRAVVRSRERLDYAGVQAALDAGSAPEALGLLREVGQRREALEADRGGVNLPLAEQEIAADGSDYRLVYRFTAPVEQWNAQISLLTGMAAAELMLDAGVGVLRTLPEAPPEELEKLRRSAVALDVDWPADMTYGALLRSLDPSRPRHAAFVHESASLLRGAGYRAIDGTVPAGEAWHAAVAAPYAHVTAPIRRLVDRFGLECCVAACAGVAVPDWVRAALPELPARMAESDRRAGELERACIDLVEAVVLAPHVGQTFDAVVIDVRRDGDGTVQLVEPAVRGRCSGADLPLGARVRVRLAEASVVERKVRFALA